MAKAWTKEEDELLLLWREQGLTAREMRSRLYNQRTLAAIKSRIHQIAPVIRKKWTEEEIKLAYQLREEGKSDKYIAKVLGRTVSAVSSFFTRTATDYYTLAAKSS